MLRRPMRTVESLIPIFLPARSLHVIVLTSHLSTKAFGSLVMMAALVGEAWAASNYPPEPTVIEYRVEPTWPKRPARVGRRRPCRVLLSIAGSDLVPERARLAGLHPGGRAGDQLGRRTLQKSTQPAVHSEGNVWITDHAAHVVKIHPETNCCLPLVTGKPARTQLISMGQRTPPSRKPGDVRDGQLRQPPSSISMPRASLSKPGALTAVGPASSVCPSIGCRCGICMWPTRASGSIVHPAREIPRSVDSSHHAVGLWMTSRRVVGVWFLATSMVQRRPVPAAEDQLFMRFSTIEHPSALDRACWPRRSGETGRLQLVHAVATDSQGNLTRATFSANARIRPCADGATRLPFANSGCYIPKRSLNGPDFGCSRYIALLPVATIPPFR